MPGSDVRGARDLRAALAPDRDRRAGGPSAAVTAVGVVLIVVLVAALQLAMWRVPWCTCGAIKLWHGVVQSSENSQHLTDWYTPSHVVHGILFYGAAWAVGRLRGRRLPFGLALLMAVAVEGGVGLDHIRRCDGVVAAGFVGGHQPEVGRQSPTRRRADAGGVGLVDGVDVEAGQDAGGAGGGSVRTASRANPPSPCRGRRGDRSAERARGSSSAAPG